MKPTIVAMPSRLERLTSTEAALDAVQQAVNRLGSVDRRIDEVGRLLGCARCLLGAVVAREKRKARPE